MHYWKIIGLLLLIPLSYVIGCIIYAKVTYFDPMTVITLSEDPDAPKLSQHEFSAFIWNIGYCGLGEKSDFFYDKGKMVRPEEKDMMVYFEGMMQQLQQDTVDFVMLQEVDTFSKRSYFQDQVSFIKAQHHATNPNADFAINYSVKYVPQPWLEPMGKVNSGLLSLSKFKPYKVERHQLPGAFDFITQLFFLRRCLLIQFFHLENGKDLVIINVHNSAYDDSGKLKKQEMDYLKKILTQYNDQGDFILCGGDWNQCPADFPYDKLAKGKQGDYFQTNVDSNFVDFGKWKYDETIATNRKNSTPYIKDKTFTTIIDFFWHSDNITVTKCQGIKNDFKYSDHQPVLLKFKLNDSTQAN